MSRLLADLTPLRVSPDFRRLWVGSSVSAVGSQVAAFAVMLWIWQITADPAWVGITALVGAGPLIVFALVGGSLADGLDRRRLILASTGGQLLASGVLAAVAIAGVRSIWLILLLLGVQSTASGLGAPARRALVAVLLPPDLVGAGIALSTITFQLSLLTGPALAGLVATWSLPACFVLDTVSFAVSLYAVLRLPALPPAGPATAPGLRAALAGLGYVVRRPVLRGALLSDLAATVLAMPIALFPAINAARYGGSPATLGLFLPAIAVGGLAASVLSRPLARARRPGAVMLACVAVWGAALAAFGLLSPLWAALLCLAVAGAADTTSVICRGTVVQLSTDDEHRGRVNAVDYVVGVSGPDLGSFRAGLVGATTSPVTALVVGGAMAATAAALIAWRLPGVRRFTVSAREPLVSAPG